MTYTSANNLSTSIYGTLNTVGSGGGAGGYSIPTSAIPGHTHTITTGGYVGLTGPIGPTGATGYTINGNFAFDNVEIDASTKMILKLNGRRVPGTEKFKKYRDLFLSDYKLDSSNNLHFHLLIWEKNFGDSAENPSEDYGCIIRPNDGLYLAFGSIESRNEFERWMANYAFTFFQGETLADAKLPNPRQGALTGCYVPDPAAPITDPIVVSGVKKSDFEDWAWIAGHCQHQVYRVGTGWLFEKEAEAIYFKMRG